MQYNISTSFDTFREASVFATQLAESGAPHFVIRGHNGWVVGHDKLQRQDKDIMNFQNLEQLSAYAQLLGFSARSEGGKLVFFPHGMTWKNSLVLSQSTRQGNHDLSNLTLISQNFFRPVSINWVVEFLRDNSEDARRESTEYLKKVELNKGVIEANTSASSSAYAEKDHWRAPPWHSAGLSAVQRDEDYSAGPRDDDWDGGDWAAYLSGPDFQDGEIQ